jgi:phenylacetate-CoA ligase
MTDALLSIYHRLPSAAKDAVATARGLYLRSWRYGREVEELVEQALERETWTELQWRLWREERTARVLNTAATCVPYYREQWSERRRRGDRASWEYLENWPILAKEPVRRTPALFLRDGANPKQMFHEHTSGTTGTPLDLWWSRETVRQWYALFEARWRRWYGVSCHDRWGILGGQLVTPVTQQAPPFWVWNAAMHQLYMSSYHLAPDLIPHYLRAMERYKVTYLYGYSSALHALAEGALRSGWKNTTIKVAITNAEPVYPYQRQAIEEAFQCPVRETYGMSEIVAAASECESGRLHLWPEAGITEVVDGQLICTGLLNLDMPLVRYRVGDRGGPIREGACGCGRSLPTIDLIEGRADDVLFTSDGRRVGRLDPVLKAKLPILEMQMVQERLDCVRVKCVAAPGFGPETERLIAARLRDRLGPIEVTFDLVDRIPRGANGKFRGVVCLLSEQERAQAGIHYNPMSASAAQ